MMISEIDVKTFNVPARAFVLKHKKALKKRRVGQIREKFYEIILSFRGGNKI